MGIHGQGLRGFLRQHRPPGESEYGLIVWAAELMAMDNVVLHPHQGSATHATRMAMGGLVLENIAAYVAGRPLVTPV